MRSWSCRRCGVQPLARGSEQSFEDGWFHTGDLVRQDEDHCVQFPRPSLIPSMKVGGARVFPAEVERVLVAHPHVREAVVVGVSDRRRGRFPSRWLWRSWEGGGRFAATAL